MAGFGAKYPVFRPVAEEPEGKLPVYEGELVQIGRLVKAELSVNMASGKLFADDSLAESVDEFSSGSVAMETDDIEDAVASEVYGAEVKDGTVYYNTKNDPPAGGLGYLQKLMRRKKVLYKGYFYPLVKAALGNDTAQTKSDSITFGTANTTFTVFECKSGDWRLTHEAQTEQEAKAWVRRMLGLKEESGGGTETPEPSDGEAAE